MTIWGGKNYFSISFQIMIKANVVYTYFFCQIIIVVFKYRHFTFFLPRQRLAPFLPICVLVAWARAICSSDDQSVPHVGATYNCRNTFPLVTTVGNTFSLVITVENTFPLVITLENTFPLVITIGNTFLMAITIGNTFLLVITVGNTLPLVITLRKTFPPLITVKFIYLFYLFFLFFFF